MLRQSSVLFVFAWLAGCPEPVVPSHADYASALKWCLDSSKGWDDYEPCCVGVAEHFGRDPYFCFRPDGGSP